METAGRQASKAATQAVSATPSMRISHCDYGRLTSILLVLMALTACASAANRKRSAAEQSDQVLVEKKGEQAKLSGARAASVGADNVTISPIGPQEAQRFPFLAPWRGMLLLAKAGLMVVVDAQQSGGGVQGNAVLLPTPAVTPKGSSAQASGAVQSVAHVPLVAAIFQVGKDGRSLRNFAAESIGITIDCNHGCDSGVARAAFRLSGMSEVPAEAGASGISTGLLMGIAGAETQVASIRLLLSDTGPSLLTEIQRPHLPNAQLRFAVEPKSAGPGTVLAVPEDHFVEGGDPLRISYAQGMVAASQYLVVPGSDSRLLVTNTLTSSAQTFAKGRAFESDFLPGGTTRIRVLPSEGSSYVRALFFAGDDATQAGFKHALEQELGNSFDAAIAGEVDRGNSSGQEALPGSVPAAGWIANESGEPLLMVTGSGGWRLRVPRETFSESETPLPLVLHAGETGDDPSQKISPLLGFQGEKLKEVVFELAAGIAADTVAVAPIGSAREQRKLLMQVMAGEGATVVSRGVMAVSRWPARMQLPHGVYEAFYISRGKGILCRVPFDVSIQRSESDVPPVSCGPASRAALAGSAQMQRLVSIDGIQSRSPLPQSLVTIRNERLNLDFKVAPAPSSTVREVFQRLGDSDHDMPDSPGVGSVWAPRTVVVPCAAGDGLTALLKSVRVALRGAINFFPFQACKDSRSDFATMRSAETLKDAGLTVVLVPPSVTSVLEDRLSLVDRLFAWEPLLRDVADPPAKKATDSVGSPISPGRAGTFIEVTAMRRLDAGRVEAAIKIGRAARGLRYVETPWRPWRVRAVSGSRMLGEWAIEPGRTDYKLTFRVAGDGPAKQTNGSVRFIVTGRMDGIVAYLFQAAGEFPVATTQFLDLPG